MAQVKGLLKKSERKSHLHTIGNREGQRSFALWLGIRGESPMTPLTVLDKVVEALQAAGATEEMITAAVKAGGEFGESRTPQVASSKNVLHQPGRTPLLQCSRLPV